MQNLIWHSQYIMVEKILWKNTKEVKEVIAIFAFLTYIYIENLLSEMN